MALLLNTGCAGMAKSGSRKGSASALHGAVGGPGYSLLNECNRNRMRRRQVCPSVNDIKLLFDLIVRNQFASLEPALQSNSFVLDIVAELNSLAFDEVGVALSVH